MCTEKYPAFIHSPGSVNWKQSGSDRTTEHYSSQTARGCAGAQDRANTVGARGTVNVIDLNDRRGVFFFIFIFIAIQHKTLTRQQRQRGSVKKRDYKSEYRPVNY